MNGYQAFCANCHRRLPFKKLDPHRMVAAGGLVREQVCLFCHTEMLDRNAMRRAGKPALKTDIISLCRSCHVQHMDYSEPGHIGAKIPREMLAHMAAVEAAGPTSRPTRELVATMKASEVRPRLLVPDSEGKIVCTTCHNPHKRGLFPPRSELAYGAIRMVGKERLSSPVRNQRLCLHCHDI